MAGVARTVMRLLLLSLIRDGLIFAEGQYTIMFQCEEDLVCFHIQHLAVRSESIRSESIAVVVNGEIRAGESNGVDPKCPLGINDLTTTLVHYRCPRQADAYSPHKSLTREFILMPGKMMSVQCVLLSYVDGGRCKTRRQGITLSWVDEAGEVIQEDSNHQIKQESNCNTTLTITFQNPQNKTFRCRATSNGREWTLPELRVRVPAGKEKGRRIIPDLLPDNEGGNRNMIGTAAVAAAACAVLTALIAVFVVKRRRMNNRLRDESNVSNTNSVTIEDQVVYANILLPIISGQILPGESTEYAFIRH